MVRNLWGILAGLLLVLSLKACGFGGVDQGSQATPEIGPTTPGATEEVAEQPARGPSSCTMLDAGGVLSEEVVLKASQECTYPPDLSEKGHFYPVEGKSTKGEDADSSTLQAGFGEYRYKDSQGNEVVKMHDGGDLTCKCPTDDDRCWDGGMAGQGDGSVDRIVAPADGWLVAWIAEPNSPSHLFFFYEHSPEVFGYLVEDPSKFGVIALLTHNSGSFFSQEEMNDEYISSMNIHGLRVEAGAPIGLCGTVSRGFSLTPHVHFELKLVGQREENESIWEWYDRGAYIYPDNYLRGLAPYEPDGDG